MEDKAKLEEYLKILSLPHLRQHHDLEVDNALRAKLGYRDFLLRITEEEVMAKMQRSVNRRLQTSGIPQIKRLEEFDFSFQPQIDEKLLRELSNLSFMDEARNIIFLGPPGVGKTHLAISMAVKACEMRKKVAFFTTDDLMKHLAEAEITGRLNKAFVSLSRLDLLVIDELGYLELNRKTATLFFQLVAARYEKKSTIITTNKSFDQWGSIFQDEVVASAILDRLLHHCYPFFIQGKSFRMKDILKN